MHSWAAVSACHQRLWVLQPSPALTQLLPSKLSGFVVLILSAMRSQSVLSLAGARVTVLDQCRWEQYYIRNSITRALIYNYVRTLPVLLHLLGH